MDAVAMNGATPLMRAIESCRFSCVEYLIKAGANVMTKNKRGAGFDIEIPLFLLHYILFQKFSVGKLRNLRIFEKSLMLTKDALFY